MVRQRIGLITLVTRIPMLAVVEIMKPSTENEN